MAKKFGVCAGVVAIVVLMSLVMRELKPNTNLTTGGGTILATFYPVEFLVQSVAGNRLTVKPIVPRGTEPHDFEPTTSQLSEAESAMHVFALDSSFEPWTAGLKDELVTFVGSPMISQTDPHVWLDPVLMARMAKTVADKLNQLDPTGKTTYEQNLAKMVEEIDALDTKLRQGLKDCEHRSFVASHDAFSYFANRYGLRQIPVSGLSSEDEPTPKELAETIDVVKNLKLPAVFLEDLENSRMVDTIANETGAKVLILSPIEFLENGEDNYIRVMERNLEQLRTGLNCK